MKKTVCILLAALIVLGTVGISFADDAALLTGDKITEKEGIEVGTKGINIRNGKTYFAFDNVDLTGINSVEVTVTGTMYGHTSGATLLVMTDDAKSGKVIGTVTISETGKEKVVKGTIEPTNGKHKLIFRVLYFSNVAEEIWISKIALSKEKYVSDKSEKCVPDSKIKDVYADTWAAVDDMGRAVADYEEVGDVKTDGREVAMFYWNWHGAHFSPTWRATVISDIVKAHPEAKEDYTNPVWDTSGVYYWAEPLLGYYTSYDYWTYRKHAEMLANAGVDFIMFDYSNNGWTYVQTLNTLVAAFRDSKAAGVNVPRISAMMELGGGRYEPSFRGLTSIYYNCFVENDYSDIWYYYEGKPLLYGESDYENSLKYLEKDDKAEMDILEMLKGFFTFRGNGGRNNYKDEATGSNNWHWLDNFPQVQRNKDASGRAEAVALGTAINQSTLIGGSQTGVFSDQYNKGRGFSEVFKEDYRDIGKRQAYFFREQAALVLEAAPKFVLIDGWNEWIAGRNENYNGFKNSFVDCYDDENSRDFEPSAGALKDDCYNLLCDFVRKYKGVRKAPIASGMKTIDINSDVSGWDSVGPEFLNNSQNYERDVDGMGKSRELVGNNFEQWHYKTTVNNAIISAKATFDDNNIYFLVKTEEPIKTGNDNWMHLFINTDRNHATGWEGYDYAVNVGGAGAVSSYNGGWQKLGDAKYAVSGNALQLEIPRSLIGVTGTVNLEFKWTDSVACDNILNFYKDGSSAPLGRFNYLFTEVEQTALTAEERAALAGTTVIRAGSNRMVVSGGKMYVYEPDTRITPFEANGTLYIPEYAFSEIMGYGRTKTRYEAAFDMFLTYRYEMNDALTEVTDYTWTNGVIGSNEISVNGETMYLSAPVTVKDGIIYIPASMLSECYGVTVRSLGNGAYCIGQAAEAAVNAALSHIG